VTGSHAARPFGRTDPGGVTSERAPAAMWVLAQATVVSSFPGTESRDDRRETLYDPVRPFENVGPIVAMAFSRFEREFGRPVHRTCLEEVGVEDPEPSRSGSTGLVAGGVF